MDDPPAESLSAFSHDQPIRVDHPSFDPRAAARLHEITPEVVPMTWTAAFWSAPISPYESLTIVYPSRGFHNQTLRQIVRVRGGGEFLRVRLSNLYGKQPFTIARTRMAALEAGSLRSSRAPTLRSPSAGRRT